MSKKAIEAPRWFREGAIYQINPRTFSSEGTISAVTKELVFLQGLGFSTMYLCPIFKEDDSENLENWSERQKKSQTGNPKNPYRMMDYFEIDEEYGTADDLREFVRESHRLGMHVMLDLVYLHIGPNATILKSHPEFAQHNEDGSVRETIWHFPYLNFENEGLREYLYTNMCYYIGEFDVDGFRCDVGDGVPLDFWEEGRRRIWRIKKDAVLLNEGRDPLYVEKAFDACYAFDWHENLYKVFTGEMSIQDVMKEEIRAKEEFPEGTLFMRDIDNHDTVTDWPCRAETAAGHDGMDLIQVLNFMMDGIPMVYTSDELADETQLSMFANRFHPGRFKATDRSIRTEAYSVHRQELIRKLNALRKEWPVLSGFMPAVADGGIQDAELLVFRRREDGQEVTFIGNFSKEEKLVPMSLKEGGILLQDGAEYEKEKEVSLKRYGYIVIGKQ